MIPVQPQVGMPVLLSAAAAVAAVLFGMLLLGSSGPNRSRIRQRARSLRERGNRGSSHAAAATSLRRHGQASLLGSSSRLVLRFVPRPEVLRSQLTLAGLRINLADFILVCAALGIGVAAAVMLLGASPVLSVGIGLLAGAGLPAFYIRIRKGRRAQRFLSLLPEAIDLIVRALKSGLPVTEAISLIGSEVADPVGELFREVASNVRIGMTIEEALWSAAKRIDLPEFRFLVVTVAIQQETGGNLGAILENLSTMVRKREQMKLKVRAMSSEARASATIIGSLPFIMAVVIFFINPDYILTFVDDPRGHMLAAAGLASMGLGIGVIMKMVRFEI